MPIQSCRAKCCRHRLEQKVTQTRQMATCMDRSSLDDIVHYLTPVERLRGWIFRLLLILSIPAVYLLIKNREKKSLVLLVILLWNIMHVFLLVGQERFRYQVEWIYVILAVYSIAYLTAKFRKDLPQRAEISM
jgi:hypothetical protein